jgi:lipopolysaccharide heptosyltransferase II
MSALTRSFRDRVVKSALDVVAAATPRVRRLTNRRTIGIFMFWGIGDAVLTTPFLRALRSSEPSARIVAIGKPFLPSLLGEEGLIDEFVTLVPPWTRHRGKYRLWSDEWREFAGLVRQLAARRFDLLVSLRPDPRETALARLLSPAEFAGYANAGAAGWVDVDLGSDVTNEPSTYRGELAAIAAERLLGSRPSSEPSLRLCGPPPGLMSQLSAAGYRGGPILAVAFGAAHELRRWSADKIGQALATLRQPPGAYLLIEGDDSPRIEAPRDAPSLRWRGPLGELRRVLSVTDVAFCTDSGTMHIAGALDCRVVAVFGPGSLGRFAPRASQHAAYAVKPMPCRPCYDSCIYPSPLCMDRIDIAAVAARLDASLATVERPRAAVTHRVAV